MAAMAALAVYSTMSYVLPTKPWPRTLLQLQLQLQPRQKYSMTNYSYRLA